MPVFLSILSLVCRYSNDVTRARSNSIWYVADAVARAAIVNADAVGARRCATSAFRTVHEASDGTPFVIYRVRPYFANRGGQHREAEADGGEDRGAEAGRVEESGHGQNLQGVDSARGASRPRDTGSLHQNAGGEPQARVFLAVGQELDCAGQVAEEWLIRGTP